MLNTTTRVILPKLSRVALVLSLALYLLGYQPTLGIPPLKKSLAYASFSQEQAIKSLSFTEPLQNPHPGYLSTPYSPYHPGIDIATGLGMPVKPILKGKVVEVSVGFFGLGHYVVLEHEQGLKSTYGHMGRIYTKVGDEVTTSSILGEVGLTGRTSGPHTHLEIAKDGRTIDPKTLLPELPNIAEAWANSVGGK